jgi:hypothetical protein
MNPEVLINFAHSIFNFQDKIYYLSTPLTTGKLYLDKIKTKEIELNVDDSIFNLEIFNKNKYNADKLILKYKSLIKNPILNPGQLGFIKEWSHQDYRKFWSQIIKFYVENIIFVNEWEYSKGCIYEFYLANIYNIPMYNQNLEILSPDEGFSRVEFALEYMED